MKKFTLVLVMLASPAMAQQQPPQPPEPNITVTLPMSEYQTVLNELGKLPWNQINKTMVTMIQAAQAALVPQPPALEGKKENESPK